MFTYSDSEVRNLVLRTYPRLTSFVCRFMHCTKAEAEDVLQDALLKVIQKRAEVSVGKIDGYLYTTVRNLCVNKLQRDNARPLNLDDLVQQSPWNILASVDFEGWTPDSSESNERIKSLDAADVIKYADSFSPRTREIFMMSRVDGKTHKEIAEEEGISERAVEKHLQKTVAAFRDHFKK